MSTASILDINVTEEHFPRYDPAHSDADPMVPPAHVTHSQWNRAVRTDGLRARGPLRVRAARHRRRAAAGHQRTALALRGADAATRLAPAVRR
jgi:hypothetical protein